MNPGAAANSWCNYAAIPLIFAHIPLAVMHHCEIFPVLLGIVNGQIRFPRMPQMQQRIVERKAGDAAQGSAEAIEGVILAAPSEEPFIHAAGEVKGLPVEDAHAAGAANTPPALERPLDVAGVHQLLRLPFG